MYRCYFDIVLAEGRIHFGYVDWNNMADLLSGFWINMDGGFTKGSDCSIFIPQGRITGIEKVSE